jgi:small subunit ribosomal protein S16
MPVKIRLTRMGKKKQPTYRVVVMDSRSPRDGRYIDQIGRYDPRQEPSLIEIDNDKALDWLEKGAQPTDAARRLLEVSGAWTRFRIARGDIHTIDAPARAAATPPTAAEADADADQGSADAVPGEIHVVESFEEEDVTPEAETPGEAVTTEAETPGEAVTTEAVTTARRPGRPSPPRLRRPGRP